MNKKYGILVILFIAIIAIQISSVNALTSEQKNEANKLIDSIPDGDLFYGGDVQSLSGHGDYKIVRIKVTDEYMSGGEVVKKNGIYQQRMRFYDKIRIFDVYFYNYYDGYEYDDFELISSNNKLIKNEYTSAKKGDWIKVHSISSTKTIQQNGKIYKGRHYTVTRVVTPTKAEKVRILHDKKLVAYYKTFKMPTFKVGNYKWGNFKSNSFTYGNSKIGYYVNHLRDDRYYNSKNRVYKVTPKNSNFLGSAVFSKKPSSFTLYAYA
jgi:hypothetical protein